MLTLLDLGLLLVLGLSVVHGWRRGVASIAFRLAGVLLGFVGGLLLAGRVLSPRLAPLTHLALGLLCVVGVVLLGRAVGTRLGAGLAAALRRLHLGVVDRAAGAVAAGVVAALTIWLVGALVATVYAPAVRTAEQRSVVLSGLRRALPSTDRLSVDVRRSTHGAVPADLLALLPAGSGITTAVGSSSLDATARSRGRSVVKVLASACGSIAEGTAFVAGRDGAADLLVTNAHVVRGSGDVTVSDGPDRHAATVVSYDADADLAVLRVAGFDAPALPLADAPAANGTSAEILGYPRDGALTETAADVLQRLPTVQPNSAGLGVREVYRIRAAVQHGNSGSPLITADGRVIGVVNALSLLEHDTGYALTASSVRTELAGVGAASGAVDTGTCSAGS